MPLHAELLIFFFTLSLTPLQERVQCLGERLKTLKMQMLTKRCAAVNYCDPETSIAYTSSFCLLLNVSFCSNVEIMHHMVPK